MYKIKVNLWTDNKKAGLSLIFIIIAFIVWLPVITYGAEIYKWIDENDVINYSDMPPVVDSPRNQKIKILHNRSNSKAAYKDGVTEKTLQMNI